MKNRNLSRLKYYILAGLFVVTAIVTFISMNYQSASPSTTIMTQSTLPVVVMQTENGMQFNRLHGYTRNMDESMSINTLTPLSSDKKLPIVIHTYGESITGISYKVRDMNDRSLIENTTITNYSVDSDTVSAQLNIKNLIEDDTEYMLQIIISTEEHEEISYYTKIISGTDYNVEDKLNFVIGYNQMTLDPLQITNAVKYLEISSVGATNNYGNVNIHSTQQLIGWGDLNPFVQSEIIPTIQEIDSDVAIITLDYSMGAENDYESYDSYNVNEYYRIRQLDTQFYLLNYERTANQVFDARNDLTTSSKINLGVTSSTDVTYKESSNQTYTYFINEGSLWCFDADNNIFTDVFSFMTDDSDNTRESYQMHDFEIVDVTDDGDCTFLLNGYMNRGLHEGEVGISLFSYDYESNIVEEKAYIPLDVSYEIASENVGGIAYIRDNNIFYILINNTMYAIDMTSKEIMTEISDLKDGTYATAPSRQAIAYSTNGELYNTDTIRIFDVSQSNDYLINADDGDCLRVIGYINDDFVYGVAHKSDILVEDNGNTVFPMYKVCIVNSSYEEVKVYQEDGVYISDASISNYRVNLTRVTKDGSGNYQSTSIDQLINKDENASDSSAYIDTYTTTSRLQETLLALSTTLSNTETVSMRTSKEVVFRHDGDITLDDPLAGNSRFYVYGYGTFQGSYLSVSEAIQAAYDTYGTVMDDNNTLIWTRYKTNYASLKSITSVTSSASSSILASLDAVLKNNGLTVDVDQQLALGHSALDILNTEMDQKALNLKGVTLENVLYFINAGYPVIGRIDGDTYVIITAYDSTSLSYYNPLTGATETKTIAQATTLFAQWGNTFISYYK